MKTGFFICLILFIPSLIYAQIINAYAKVETIDGNSLNLTNTNENADSFEDNEQVIVIQMQDNVLGPQGNNSNFGNLSNIRSAGLYEVRTIESHTTNAGGTNSITLSQPLLNTYTMGANSSVQVISFPKMGDPDYTTTSNLSALDWNGSIGGVLAMDINGTLTLNHDLSASSAGFRGGQNAEWVSGYYIHILWFQFWIDNEALSCDPTEYRNNLPYNYYASKGEGIYRSTNNNYVRARGKILNGAGGGNQNNSGGGGGGNYTAGGEGGMGYGGSNGCSPGSGGLGGISLEGNIMSDRIFMGGGGGGGQGNDNTSTPGGDGGGLILIRANKIKTSDGAASVRISANGRNANNSGSDGAGGAGAGGSICMHVLSWDISPSGPLTIEANGGNGGSVNTSAIHGGGGGGGQGVVIFSFSKPSENVTITTTNGIGGCNNNANPCISQAKSGDGVNSAGIMENTIGPLPIELLNFTTEKAGLSKVKLSWQTATEINNDYFEIERSPDAEKWEKILEIPGAGNSSNLLSYSAEDSQPLSGINYYRLKQTDFNGEYSYSHISYVNFDFITGRQDEMIIYPNPARSEVNVLYENLSQSKLTFYNADYELMEIPFTTDGNIQKFLTHGLTPGIYYINLLNSTTSITQRVIVVK